MQTYLNSNIAESSPSTLIIDWLDCKAIILIPSRVNMVFPILSLFSYKSKTYAVLCCNFPGWQQLSPQTLDSTETQTEEQKSLKYDRQWRA